MKYLHKLLDYAFYMFFGMMVLGAFMIAIGMLTFVFSFGQWTGGLYYLWQYGGGVFGLGFYCLMGTGFIGVLSGYLK